MTLWILSSFFFTLALNAMAASTPASLSINIWIIALLTACLISYCSSPWFGFIIFLIYIGGMLVIFAYFTAINPNQYISTTIINIFLPAILWLIILPLIMPALPIITYNPLTLPPALILIKYGPILILTFLLFFTIVAVAKITPSYTGALRPLRPKLYVPAFTKISPSD